MSKDTKPQAHFGEGRSESILRGLLEQSVAGLRVENTFKKEAWKSVTDEFNKRYHEEYSIQALKNHYSSQRLSYKTFSTLKGSSGAGWDDHKKMVTGSDEWWKHKIEANSKYRPFRNKGFPNFEIMGQLEDGRNADDTMVRGSRVTKKTQAKTHELTAEEMALDDESNKADGNNSDLPEFKLSEGTGAPLVEGLIDTTTTPAGFPSSPAPPTSPSPPPKPINAKRAAPCSPKPRRHRKKADHPSSTDALLILATVSKEKLAAKECDRKEAIRTREERQAQIDKMNYEREIQLEKMRNERKAESEANALERLRFNESRIQAKVEKYPNQVKAMETFRSEVKDNILDRDQKMKAAIILNVEEKAFFFNQLPEDMRWDWLNNEIKSN